MISVRVNDYKLKIPIAWHEVSVELYQKLKSIDEPDIVKVFSVVTGLESFEILESKKEELEVAMYTVSSFAFTEEYFRNDKMPSVIRILDKEVRIPQKLEAMTIEQNLLIRQKLIGLKFIEQGISYCTAVYLQPLIDGGKFNAERVPEIESAVLMMPIDEVFQVGFFLSNRLSNYGRSGAGHYQRVLIWWMNFRRKLKKWRK
jgi:hypothetical protein